MKRVFVALKKEAPLWHSSLKRGEQIILFCLYDDPALKTNIVEKLANHECTEINIEAQDEMGIGFEMMKKLEEELQKIEEPFSLFIIGEQAEKYTVPSVLKDVEMLNAFGYHNSFKVGKVKLTPRKDLTTEQLMIKPDKKERANFQEVNTALQKAAEASEKYQNEEDSVDEIMDKVFGTSFQQRKATASEINPLAASKAILTNIMQERLRKHIFQTLGEELTPKESFTLETLLIKSNDKDSFIVSWRTVYPGSKIHFKDEEDFLRVKEEAEYYNAVCVMLYGADKWGN